MAMSETRTCQNCKNQFTIEPEDFSFYENIEVPPPTWCPECRTIRRFSFWNERNLFRAQDAKTSKEIFSSYPSASGLKLYEHDYWWSDEWDAMRYGREYDFSKPFFVQFKELLHKVPLAARSIWHVTNSEYCGNATRLKNCYLCFDGDQSEDCLYGIGFKYCKNSLDFNQANYLESCYELLSCDRCHQTFFAVECDDCRDVWFSYECYDCSHCFGCVNLRHKKYHIFNTPYTEKDYWEKIKSFNLGSYRALEEIKKKVYPFWARFPKRYMHGTHNENVVGEYVYHAKNVKYCYQSDKDIKDLKYCQRVVNGVANSYDYTSWGDNSELMYEDLICGENARNVKFCMECWPACEDTEYSMSCHSSTNLFGCVGLKKKSYCILNREYPEAEFKKLREKIIRHMSETPYISQRANGKEQIVYKYGEFFPPEFSPFAYNETIAQDFFPLTRKEALEKGFGWREPEVKEFKISLKAGDIPDNIREVTDDVTKEIVRCLSCTRAYRILPAELTFHKRFALPLPRRCHECRYRERFAFRKPLRWYPSTCMCAGRVSGEQLATGYQYMNSTQHFHKEDSCPSVFETPYAPDRSEIVYCEQCYQAEVV